MKYLHNTNCFQSRNQKLREQRGEHIQRRGSFRSLYKPRGCNGIIDCISINVLCAQGKLTLGEVKLFVSSLNTQSSVFRVDESVQNVPKEFIVILEWMSVPSYNTNPGIIVGIHCFVERYSSVQSEGLYLSLQC